MFVEYTKAFGQRYCPKALVRLFPEEGEFFLAEDVVVGEVVVEERAGALVEEEGVEEQAVLAEEAVAGTIVVEVDEPIDGWACVEIPEEVVAEEVVEEEGVVVEERAAEEALVEEALVEEEEVAEEEIPVEEVLVPVVEIPEVEILPGVLQESIPVGPSEVQLSPFDEYLVEHNLSRESQLLGLFWFPSDSPTGRLVSEADWRAAQAEGFTTTQSFIPVWQWYWAYVLGGV